MSKVANAKNKKLTKFTRSKTKPKKEIAPSNIITLKSVEIKNKHYYIDKFNVLYDPEPINGLYKIIGKLKNEVDDEIYYVTSL